MQRVVYGVFSFFQIDFTLCKFIELQADLGGTEILKPLKKLFYEPGIYGYFKQIFILTDGEVHIYY